MGYTKAKGTESCSICGREFDLGDEIYEVRVNNKEIKYPEYECSMVEVEMSRSCTERNRIQNSARNYARVKSNDN